VPIDAIDRFGLRRGIKAHLCLPLAPSASFENNSFGSTLSVPIQHLSAHLPVQTEDLFVSTLTPITEISESTHK
jgi:hypothetical protein